MAYDPKELEKLALKEIDTNPDCVFNDDIISILPCAKHTFYDLKLHELHSIKDGLLKNRVSKKQKMRKKWEDGDNATTQVAFYKLISDDDERQKLSNHDKVDHNIKGEVVTKVITEVIDVTKNVKKDTES